MSKRKVYGGSGYGGYRRRKKTGGIDPPVIRVTLFAALICLACVLRFSDSGPLIGLREQMNQVVRSDTDYRGAVAVLGRAIVGEGHEDESAIVVFGRKVLGLEAQAEPYQPPAAQPLSQDGQDGQPSEEEEPAIYDLEPAGAQFSGLTLWSGMGAMGMERAEEISPYPTVPEASLPVFYVSPTISHALTYQEEDDTPNEEFIIPSPDIIDDTVYRLSFSYAAPLKGPITSYFGYRIHPVSGNTSFHHGADVGVPTGTKVKAFAAGTVSEVAYSSVYGNYVKVSHPDGFLSMYAHLDKASVKVGKKVKLGDKVGESGNSGMSTGAHLHFEIRKDGKILNPFNYLSFS